MVNPMIVRRLVTPSPFVSCVPPAYNFINTSFNAIKRKVHPLIENRFRFWVLKHTNAVVSSATTGVSKTPIGGKKCPISPLSATTTNALPSAFIVLMSGLLKTK
jgi:hypothetical protein